MLMMGTFWATIFDRAECRIHQKVRSEVVVEDCRLTSDAVKVFDRYRKLRIST